MLVLVIGIPGVGKTSVVEFARPLLKHEWHIVNFGDIILSLAKEKYGITHRDYIRKMLKRKEYIELQIETAKKIKEYYEGKNVLFDTHLVIETPEGYYSGTFKEIVDILDPVACVVIVAPPEQIYERRKKDVTRIRDIEPVEKIKLQQDLTIMHAVWLLAYKNIYLKIIENPDGKLQEAAKELAEYLNHLAEVIK